MTDVIDFLERMGQDALLRDADAETLGQAMANTTISTELRAAICAADQARLEMLLGADTNVCCMIHAPDDDEDEDEEPAEDEDDKEESISFAAR